MRWRVEQVTGPAQALEDLLNALSADGWSIHSIAPNQVIAFKNRP